MSPSIRKNRSEQNRKVPTSKLCSIGASLCAACLHQDTLHLMSNDNVFLEKEMQTTHVRLQSGLAILHQYLINATNHGPQNYTRQTKEKSKRKACTILHLPDGMHRTMCLTARSWSHDPCSHAGLVIRSTTAGVDN